MLIIGCGYVGTALARYWKQQGYSVTVTTTRQERVSELEEIAARILVMKGSDFQAMLWAVENQDVIVLSIAPISDRQVDVEVYQDTYIPTARNLVTALQEVKSVKQLIYLSSCSVYGNQNGEWANEASQVNIDDEYAKVLYDTENILLSSTNEDIVTCILRLGGIYGPRRELTKRISRLAGKTIPGSGENFAYWIHLDDIVAAIEFARQNRLQGVYNLVNDLQWTSGELCDYICESQDLPKVVWDSSQESFRSFNARIDNHKIKAAGYQLIHPQNIL